MARDLGLADRMRAYGLRVVEVDGWPTRGSDYFAPRGSVNHHTAGALAGNAPSLRICIEGRPGLPGPLCNTLQARDGTIYLIAAGRANHAGTGSWQGLMGNSTVYGHEIENVGTDVEPLTAEQILIAARVHAAFLHGRPGAAAMVCQHKEWTRRKIDAHGIDGAAFRTLVAQQKPGGQDPMATVQEIQTAILPATRRQVWLMRAVEDPRVYIVDDELRQRRHIPAGVLADTMFVLNRGGTAVIDPPQDVGWHTVYEGARERVWPVAREMLESIPDATPSPGGIDVAALADALAAQLPGLDAATIKTAVQEAIRELVAA